MRKVFFYSNSILICVWVGIFFIFQFSSYGYFTDRIIKLLHIEDSSQGILISILNPGVFLKLKWLFLALAIFQTGVLILVNKKPMILQQIKKCLLSIIEYPKWLWVNFNSLNKIEKILFGSFLTVVIIQRLWLSNITDVIYDEAWTYLAFTSKTPCLPLVFIQLLIIMFSFLF